MGLSNGWVQPYIALGCWVNGLSPHSMHLSPVIVRMHINGRWCYMQSMDISTTSCLLDWKWIKGVIPVKVHGFNWSIMHLPKYSHMTDKSGNSYVNVKLKLFRNLFFLSLTVFYHLFWLNKKLLTTSVMISLHTSWTKKEDFWVWVTPFISTGFGKYCKSGGKWESLKDVIVSPKGLTSFREAPNLMALQSRLHFVIIGMSMFWLHESLIAESFSCLPMPGSLIQS